MTFSPLLNQLMDALRVLPGVGAKSAQRMALYLMEHDREGAMRLSTYLAHAVKQIGRCERCRILSEKACCIICANRNRDQTLLCVVESPAHVAAIEQTGFAGLYFVLSGNLSPIDGMGPQEVGMDALKQYLAREQIQEIVLAMNSTVEGEATAFFIASLVKGKSIKITRLAQGIPYGGDLDYIDTGTLAKAIAARSEAGYVSNR